MSAAPANYNILGTYCYQVDGLTCYICPSTSWVGFLKAHGFHEIDPRNPFTDHVHIEYGRKVVIYHTIYYFFKII